MHTRKRVLAGVTAGSLALGVLALSPVAPASAAVDTVADTAAVPYLTGSKAKVTLTATAATTTPVAAATYYTHALVTRVSGTVGVWGKALGATGYAGTASWNTLTSSASFASASDDAIGVTSSTAGSVTVRGFNDGNGNGVIDVGEGAGSTVTINFVDFASTNAVIVPTASIVATNVAAPTFSAALLSGLTPVEQDDQFGAGPYITEPAFGASFTLPGAATPTAALDVTAGAVTAGKLTGEEWAKVFAVIPTSGATGGSIALTAFFDPTGAATPGATAKTATSSITVVDQAINTGTTVTASGTGVLFGGTAVGASNPYNAALTSKTLTFEVTALRDAKTGETAPQPIANQPIVIELEGAGLAVGDKVSVDGGAATTLTGTAFEALEVNKTTDASGKATVTVTVTPAAVAGTVGAGATFSATLKSVASSTTGAAQTAVVTWTAPGTISATLSKAEMVAPAGISIPAGVAVPVYPGFKVSVPASGTQTFRATVKDTLGNPVQGSTITVTYGAAGTGSTATGVTGADGVANVNIAGLASGSFGISSITAGSTELCASCSAANVTVYFKSAAQLAASTITAPDPATETVTIGTSQISGNSVPVTFTVLDSSTPAGAMADTAGLFTVNGGAVLYPAALGEPTTKTIAEGTSATAGVTSTTGEVTVYVASATTGTKTVTLTIGGKTATATVTFSSGSPATISILPSAGGDVPAEVPSNTTIGMRVEVRDGNGNLVNSGGAYVLINVLGNATTDSGGDEVLLLVGPSGRASFNVVSGAFGSFEVTAMTNGIATVSGTITATTGEIAIAKSLEISGKRKGSRVTVRGEADGFEPGSEVKVTATKANGKKVSKTVEVSDGQTFKTKLKVGKKDATVVAKADGEKSNKIKV